MAYSEFDLPKVQNVLFDSAGIVLPSNVNALVFSPKPKMKLGIRFSFFIFLFLFFFFSFFTNTSQFSWFGEQCCWRPHWPSCDGNLQRFYSICQDSRGLSGGSQEPRSCSGVHRGESGGELQAHHHQRIDARTGVLHTATRRSRFTRGI